MTSQSDIGSKHQRIPNPLRPFGLIEIITGLIAIFMSVNLLLKVSTLVSSGSNPAAWLAAIMGLVIIVQGGFLTFAGMFKCFSLVIGRNDPKSLSHNYNNESESQFNMHYNNAELAQMLMSRQNKTFVEPRCWVESLYFSCFRKLFFLPLPYRNVMQGCLSAIINTLIILICYIIIKFMTNTGLITGSNVTLVVSLCTLFLGAKLFFIWRAAYTIERNSIASPDNLSFKHLILTIAYATLIPTILVSLFNYIAIPKDYNFLNNIISFITSVDWSFWFLCFALFPIIASIPIFYMGFRKSQEYSLRTEVSERIVNWQESIHPREVFIGIENVAMAKRRYMEVPNRVYAKLEPILKVQSDGNKGEFSGYTIQETQPKWISNEQNIGFGIAKYVTAVISAVLIISIFSLMTDFVTDFTFKWKGTFEVGLLSTIIDLLLKVLLFWIAAKILKGASLLFFSELKFSSFLIYFKTEGTFTESKVSSGASIYDSNRSENSVIRSSINQWIVASRLTTTTFLGTTLSKFDNARYVMEMDADDFQIDAILNDLKRFVASREIVADVAENDKSARVAEHILNMNARAKAVTKVACDNPEAIAAINPQGISDNGAVIGSSIDDNDNQNNSAVSNDE